MLEIRHTEVVGLERSILASRNPMSIGDIDTSTPDDWDDNIASLTGGSNRPQKLGSSPKGEGHDNFLSGIDVYYDVKYSLYWTPEFQRYHFNQIISSQSKMHKLTNMAININFDKLFNKYVDKDNIDKVKNYVSMYMYFDNMELNTDGTFSNDSNDKYTMEEIVEKKYYYFMKALSNLPAGFEQWMTIKTNYLQLKTMYDQRKNHKLKEDWSVLCAWCLTLPHFVELTGVK